MQPNSSNQLTGSEGDNGGGAGNSNASAGNSIAQALGFVAEFNENALIFNQILFPMLVMHELSLITHASHIARLNEEMVSVWHRIAQLAGNNSSGGDSTYRPAAVTSLTE